MAEGSGITVWEQIKTGSKHGITVVTGFLTKNWNPYNEKERERYRQERIPGFVLQSTSVHLKFSLV